MMESRTQPVWVKVKEEPANMVVSTSDLSIPGASHSNHLEDPLSLCAAATDIKDEVIVKDEPIEDVSPVGGSGGIGAKKNCIAFTHQPVKTGSGPPTPQPVKDEGLTVATGALSAELKLPENEVDSLTTSEEFVEMIRLHVTVSSYKKMLSVSPEFFSLDGLTKLIREKFPSASIPKNILIQYWFEEEDFSEWIDLDEDTIKTFEDQKIHKLKVLVLQDPDESAMSASHRSTARKEPQADDVHPTASPSHSSLTVPASSSAPSESGLNPGGKDHSTPFPVRYRIPLQQLPHDLKEKHENNVHLDQQDVRHLLTCIYNHVTTHYEDSFYPTTEQYISMANAVLTTFPAILRNSDLEEHELQLLWKRRIQHKFQNSRKRQDSAVTEVGARKKKKASHVAAEETERSLMYGVEAYLPPRPHSEDDDSLERHRQWLALEWSKRDPDLDKVERLMQLTLSERRKKIVSGNISVAEIFHLYPWIQSFDGIVKEFLRLEPQADEPDPRVAILLGLEKYRLPVIALLKKRK